MQESNPLGGISVQPTQLPKVTHLLAFLLRPVCKLRQRTAAPRSAITAWYSSDAIVDVESDKLSGAGGAGLIAAEQLEDDAAAHGRDLRLAPFTRVWNVCDGEVFIVVDDVEGCDHWCYVAIVDAAKPQSPRHRTCSDSTYKLKNRGPALGPSSNRFVVAFSHSHPMLGAYF